MNVESLVDQIAGDLNDDAPGYEFHTWSAEQIRAWIVEAMGIVYDKRPDLFIEKKIIQVKPCSIIQDTDGCDSIRRVIGQTTADGRLIKELNERDLEISFEWTGKPCYKVSSGSGFKLESYAVDTVSDTLYIWPQVPPGVTVYVQVECSSIPDGTGNFEVGNQYHAAVVQWVLWRAKSMDMEISSAAMTAAEFHYKVFLDLLGLAASVQEIIHKKEKP